METTNSLSHPWDESGLTTRARLGTAAVAAVLREHRVVLCLAVGYIAVGGLLLTALGRRWPIELTSAPFALVWGAMSAVWLGWQFLRSPRRLRRALSVQRLFGALIVAGLVVPTQITFQALKQSIGPVVGFHADPLLHRLDLLLHGQAPWMWLEPLLANAALVRALDRLYMGWFGLLFVFFFWASWSSRRDLRNRALITFLLLWIAGGTVTAWAASSGGPCYYAQVVGGTNPYQPLLDRLDAIGTVDGPLRARINQRGLWEIRQADQWAHFAGISAMPSLHVAVSVLFALVAWQRSRILGCLLTCYAVAIQVGSVVLAWHYAVDGYLGAALAVLCWLAAGALVRRAHSETAVSSAGADPQVARA